MVRPILGLFMSYRDVVLAALCAVITMVAPARAAFFDHKSLDGLNTIYVSGPIVEGDSDRFKQIAAPIAGPAFWF
jgi:hypothetical protein